MKKILTLLPGLLTVCVVALSAAFLVTHPPQPAAQSVAPNSTGPASPGGTVPASTPSPSAPTTAAPLSAPAPPAAPAPTTQPAPAPPPAPATSPAPTPSASPPATPPPTKPAPTPATPPAPAKPAPSAGAPSIPARPSQASASRNGYRVQAGVFRNRVYAEDLMRQLRQKGYEVTLIEGSLLRVVVGPATSRADAERLAAKLHASGFEALVTAVR